MRYFSENWDILVEDRTLFNMAICVGQSIIIQALDGPNGLTLALRLGLVPVA